MMEWIDIETTPPEPDEWYFTCSEIRDRKTKEIIWRNQFDYDGGIRAGWRSYGGDHEERVTHYAKPTPPQTQQKGERP